MQAQTERRISLFVSAEIKEWARKEAAKHKWSLSFFCQEVLLAAMEKSKPEDDKEPAQ